MHAPKLEFAFEIAIELSPRLRYGPNIWGLERGFVGVTGGTVSGPMLNGIVMPHTGGDWPTVRASDHTVRFDARYLLQADDGTIIELVNKGVRTGSKDVLQRLNDYQPVDPSEYYMALTPTFDAPAGPHEWLSTAVFIGKADRRETRSVFTYWMVL